MNDSAGMKDLDSAWMKDLDSAWMKDLDSAWMKDLDWVNSTAPVTAALASMALLIWRAS
jgi:hypothetical protein